MKQRVASTRGAPGEAEKEAQSLLANFGLDSLVTLRDVIWKAVDEKRAARGASSDNAARHKTLQTLRVQLRELRYKTGLKEKRRVEDGVLDKFSGFAPADIASRFARGATDGTRDFLSTARQPHLDGGKLSEYSRFRILPNLR